MYSNLCVFYDHECLFDPGVHCKWDEENLILVTDLFERSQNRRENMTSRFPFGGTGVFFVMHFIEEHCNQYDCNHAETHIDSNQCKYLKQKQDDEEMTYGFKDC